MLSIPVTDEEREAQRGSVTCPGSHSRSALIFLIKKFNAFKR